MSNGIKLTVRPDTKAQLERHKRAAKLRHWSVNRLYLEAADKMTDEILDQELYKQALAAKSEEGLPA